MVRMEVREGYSGGMNRIQRITIAMAMAVVEPFTMPD